MDIDDNDNNNDLGILEPRKGYHCSVFRLLYINTSVYIVIITSTFPIAVRYLNNLNIISLPSYQYIETS
jgi:hypothetical protein